MKVAIVTRPGSISPLSEKSAMSPRSPTVVNETGIPFHRVIRSCRLSLDSKERMDWPPPKGKPNPLRRARSDTDLITTTPPFSSGTKWFPTAILAEVEIDDPLPVTEELSGGGSGRGAKTAAAGGDDGKDGGDRGLRNYYLEMLKADPGNPLILRNYARFLHEVERDLKKAEEFYSRAILASPNDGELLSLFGRLLWEAQRDSDRAEDYYERAVAAAPNDCYVLGSYAHFLWDAEEEDEEEGRVTSSPALIEAM